MSSRSFEETEEEFFKYYDNLPLLKELSPLEFETIRDKEGKINIRAYIIKALADGIESKTSQSDTKRIRHVLSANEIQVKLEGYLDQEVTLSNIYFHLQKLEDVGLVQIVDSLPSGRRFTAYYGRVARVFILYEEASNPLISMLNNNRDEDIAFMESIRKFGYHVSGKSKEEVNAIIDEAISVNMHPINHDDDYIIQLNDWISRNEKIIREVDLSIIYMNHLFMKLIDFQPRIVKAFQALKSLLDFPDIEEYS